MDFLWRKRNCSCWTAPICSRRSGVRSPKEFMSGRKAYDGIVIIHGTDTLAYTASALSFALQQIEIPGRAYRQSGFDRESDCGCDENCRAALHMAASHCPGYMWHLTGRLCSEYGRARCGHAALTHLRALIIRMRRGSTVADCSSIRR